MAKLTLTLETSTPSSIEYLVEKVMEIVKSERDVKVELVKEVST